MPEHPRPQDVPGAQLKVISFGYGHGEKLPAADHTGDLRDWFQDPAITDELLGLTGRDQPVIDNVLNTPGVRAYIHNMVTLAVGLIDLHVRTVTIAVGCVGGRYRAPVIAEELARRVKQLGGTVQVEHLHVDRDVMGPRTEPTGSDGYETSHWVTTGSGEPRG